MVINRDAELEKNMFSKLSDIDNIMHKKDAYALGLRLNALSSLCRALRTKEAVSALTAALDKLEADYFTGDISVDGLKSFMPGTALYTAYDFTGDEKYKNAAVKLAEGFKNLSRNDKGYFKDEDEKKCLCKAYMYEPFYMAYETNDCGI